MVIRKRSSNQLLNKLHKGVVISCIGLTAYGCYLLGWRFHRYFTVIRPQRQEAELKMILQQQPDDKAPTLKT